MWSGRSDFIMSISEIATLITAIAAFVAAIIAISKFKTVDVAMAAAELLDDHREEIKRLKQKVSYLEKRDEENRRQIMRLSLELEQARDRISVLEGENERLLAENEELRNG